MMVPSIDIQNGRAVQLVNGERLAIDAGSAWEAAERFSILGELAVVDLDAAMGIGSNRALLLELARRYPCRLGGGFRTRDDVLMALDSGAAAVMVGTRASPEFLSAFPRDRIVAALDARGDTLMAEGWKRPAGHGVLGRALELAPYAGAFLFTDIGREGTKGGIDLDRAQALQEGLNEAGYQGRIIMAGGTRSEEDIAALDAMGLDVQVGMGLYDGSIRPARALSACLKSDRPDGLWPTLVCDESGKALGLAYSDAESLDTAIEERAGVYRSRSRGLWRKGQSSGHTQRLLRVDTDCDRDSLRFVVRQEGAFCHEGSRSCFLRGLSPRTDPADCGLYALECTVRGRMGGGKETALAGSYTARLLSEEGLLAAKLREEADELARAASAEEAAAEAADLLYFITIALAAKGSSLAEAERVLDLRSLKLSRRPGDAKLRFMANDAGEEGETR